MAVTPFSRTQSGYLGTKKVWSKSQTGWKSKPRIEDPLTFSMEVRKVAYKSWGGSDFRQNCDATRAVSDYNNSRAVQASQRAYDRAYEKLRGKVYASAEMGLLVAERREALSLVTNRVGHLYKGYQLLRKGKFGAFLGHFGIARRVGDKRRWTRPSQASAIWLEYWFGWSPLVADIHAAVEVLQAPMPSARVRAGSRVIEGWKSVNGTAGSSPYEYWTTSVVARCHLQADYVVTNPSLFRANQLGLLNPASIAWELVPFSFVVDWFIPVGDFLRQWTDWVGLSVSRPIASQYRSVKVDSSLTYYWSTNGPVLGYTNQLAECTTFNRTLNVTYKVRPVAHYNGLSATRAATSVALLIQLFKGSLRAPRS